MTTLSREWMWQVGVEGDLFNAHERTKICRNQRCVPVANDVVEDGFGTFQQWWFCSPWPRKDHPGYIVLRDKWEDNVTVRYIYEWRAWTAHDQADYDRICKSLHASKRESRDG